MISTPLEEYVERIPPRFWWLKRISIFLLVLLVALASIRWWWGVKASRAWEAEIARYRATGERLFPEDFDPQPVPDAENAALLLQQAANAPKLTKAQDMLLRDTTAHPEKLESNRDAVTELLTLSAPARDLVRRARGLTRFDWGYRWRSLGAPAPRLQPYVDLSRIIIMDASHFHLIEQDDAAIENIRDVLSLGRHIESYPTLLAALFDAGFAREVADFIERAGPEMKLIPEAARSGELSHAAGINQIKGLIDDLLDERAMRQGFVTSFYRERAFHLMCVQMADSGSGAIFSSNPNKEKIIAFVFRPAFQLDGIRMLKRATILAEAASAPTRPAAKKLLNTIPPVKWTNDLRGRSRILSEMVTPNFSGTVERWFESLARRRMAAVALAIRLYEAEHHQLPPSLNALVPDDIPAIPIDPLADDGRKIQYESDKDRPSLYCTDPSGSIRLYLSRKRPATGSRQS